MNTVITRVRILLGLVTSLQGLTGFALLTASLTWFIQIYPPLSRRRALAMSLNGDTPQDVFAAYAADHRAHQR